jgi:sugar/nucleoside kinase (ribokinase family)
MSTRTSASPREVLIVGSVAFDDLETPLGDKGRVVGGSATYASIAASYHAPVRLVGVVGGDFVNEIPRLKRRGIDLSGLQVVPEGKTFFWSGVYHENFAGRTTRATELNVFAEFNPVLPKAYAKTPFVLLANIQPELQHRVLDQMQGKSFVAADTMNLWINLTRKDLDRLLPRLDLFILNDEEAEMMTGLKDIHLAGVELRRRGPKSVLIKKGAHGAVLFHSKGTFTTPAFPVPEVRDPTGAGDSFAGALIGSLAAQRASDFQALCRAMFDATAAASFTVQALGPDALEKAGRAALARRTAKLLAMTQIPSK